MISGTRLTSRGVRPLPTCHKLSRVSIIPSERLTQRILETARSLSEGTPVGAKQLFHLGSRAAVAQALARLTKRGELIRVARGAYVLPVESRFGVIAPALSKLIQGYAAERGQVVANHGAASANELGLTTQVQVRPVFWTSGPSSTLRVGAEKVELQHARPWQLVLPTRPAGEVIRAMAWLGPTRAHEAVERARAILPRDEVEAILAVRGHLPTWVAHEVSALAHAGGLAWT